MPSDVTARLRAIRREHVIAAIEDIKRNGFPPAHASKNYDLIHEDVAYPQKYVASLATRYASGSQLMPDQFNAGQSLPMLEALGFTIRTARSAARHAIDGSYEGASPSFRPKPTKTPIDLTRANTIPNEPLSDRDSAFLSDIWNEYGMDEFQRLNMDAGNIRRLLERGYVEYVSGDPATTQCIFRLTAKAHTVFESQERLFLDEAGAQSVHMEGGMSEAMRSSYKRNAKARAACLAHHGYSCAVCRFNFEAIYGAIGRQYIHVHHENEMALSGGKEYVIDPIKDLKPVCPNCHAMLHQRVPAYSIEELQVKLAKNVRNAA